MPEPPHGLVLSLFPGADLFGMAFAAEGWCVVRGPDLLLGGDIRAWDALPGRFDGIIGGPPCQSFSVAIAARGGPDAALHGNLIPEFERLVQQAQPRWWVMENVLGAPLPDLPDLIWNDVLDAHAYGAAQHRSRRFSSNLPLHRHLHPVPTQERHPDPFPCLTATEYKVSAGSNERVMRQRAGRKVGRRLTIAEMNVGMGLPLDFATPALLVSSAYQVRGNGVPLPMGRAIARAIADAEDAAPH